MGETRTRVWSRAFLKALAGKRKVAIRPGELQEHEGAYRLKRKAVNALCRGEKHIEDLTGRVYSLSAIAEKARRTGDRLRRL